MGVVGVDPFATLLNIPFSTIRLVATDLGS